MAIGDTFSALAGDRRAQHAQSAANYFNDIGAFQRQQALDDQARSRDLSFAMNLQQMQNQREREQLALNEDAQRRAEAQELNRLSYFTNRSDAAANRDMGLRDQALRKSYFDLETKKFDAANAERAGVSENTGAATAWQFGESEKQLGQALEKLKKLTHAENSLINDFSNPSLGITLNKATGRYGAARNEPAFMRAAESANMRLDEIAVAADEAEQEARMLQRQHERLLSGLQKDFALGPDKTLIFKKTGTPFRYGQAPTSYFGPTNAAPLLTQQTRPVPTNAPPFPPDLQLRFQSDDPEAAMMSRRMGVDQAPTNGWARAFSTPAAPVTPETNTFPTPRNRAEYEALPSGTVFVNPSDGTLLTKP